MQHVLDAIQSGASADDLANIPVPESYRAVHVLKDEQEMWKGVPSKDKDPRRSLHVGEVPTPELAPDEVYLAVMASSINFNTVWSSIFEPVSTFGPMARLGRESAWAKRHDRDYQVVGSDASGVVLRVGAAVRNWKPGDRITVHCNHVDDQDQSAHDDSMMAANQRIWGYETNFGGLADLAVVKANQLMPKPAHLTWEEAAVNALCNSTSYRMLVSRNGAQMKQGDVVLIWGASGGIGAYATQYVLNGGGIPVGVVSSPDKADILRQMGCEAIIDRKAANYKFWNDDNTHNESEWRRLGGDIRATRSGRERRRDVAVTRDELRGPRLGHPQLAHLAVPLLAAERELLDVHVAEAVFLRGLFSVETLAIDAGEIFLGGTIALEGAHLEDVIARLRARHTLRDRVERGRRNQRLRVGLFLRRQAGGKHGNGGGSKESSAHAAQIT